jgi:hypothetical protein
MPTTAETKVLRISAKADGYRREGLKFGVAEADIPESVLTSSQVHRLKRDPMLSCKEVTVRDAPAISDDELATLRDKAAIGEAFLAKVPADFTWSECPTEYVTHLQDHVHELEVAALAETTARAEARAAVAAEAAKHTQPKKLHGKP